MKLTERQRNVCRFYAGADPDFEVEIDGWKGRFRTLLAAYDKETYFDPLEKKVIVPDNTFSEPEQLPLFGETL